MPGSFVYVTLHVPVKSLPQVPVGALVFRGDNAFVAKVDKGNAVHFSPVKVTTTDGSMASVSEGLTLGERVAMNLPGEVGDGAAIQPVTAAAKN